MTTTIPISHDWPDGPDCTYSDPPAWALTIIDAVAAEAGKSIRPLVMWADDSEDGDGLNGMAAPPKESAAFPDGMVWLHPHSTKSRTKHTIYHEMAHWLCPPDEEHGPLFYRTALSLFRRHGVSFNVWAELEDWVEADFQGVDLESLWKELG